MIKNLLEGSTACLTGIVLRIDKVYDKLKSVASLDNQILQFLSQDFSFKDLALSNFIQQNHPWSVDEKVLKDRSLAHKHFAHMKNAYLILLGKELGMPGIDKIRTDAFAIKAINDGLHKDKQQALLEIKANINAEEIAKAIVSDVNNENCNYEQTIRRNKVAEWVYSREYGLEFEGQTFPAMDDLVARYVWKDMSDEEGFIWCQ